MANNRSPLVWLGSKYRYVQDDQPLGRLFRSWNHSGLTFYEPFCGAAHATLCVTERNQKVFLNDDNWGVACFWTSVIRWPCALQNAFWSLRPSEDLFLKLRYLPHVPSDSSREEVIRCAANFLALNRWSVNGIGRVWLNRNSGKGANAISQIDWCHWRMSFLRIIDDRCHSLDWRQAVSDSRECLHFVDPPYILNGRDRYSCCFSVAQHIALRDWLMESSFCSWILTYGDVDEVRNLYHLDSEDLFSQTFDNVGRGCRNLGHQDGQLLVAKRPVP